MDTNVTRFPAPEIVATIEAAIREKPHGAAREAGTFICDFGNEEWAVDVFIGRLAIEAAAYPRGRPGLRRTFTLPLTGHDGLGEALGRAVAGLLSAEAARGAG
jgi:hypothetical protein